MSRFYHMDIATDFSKLDKKTEEYILSLDNEVWLTGGISEKEYAQNIIEKIWKIADKYVDVVIGLTYMEDLPREEYNSDQDSYIKYQQKKDNNER